MYRVHAVFYSSPSFLSLSLAFAVSSHFDRDARSTENLVFPVAGGSSPTLSAQLRPMHAASFSAVSNHGNVVFDCRSQYPSHCRSPFIQQASFFLLPCDIIDCEPQYLFRYMVIGGGIIMVIRGTREGGGASQLLVQGHGYQYQRERGGGGGGGRCR